MNCKVLTPGEITDWAACFPQELFMELMLQKEGLHALGVSFLEEAQGALVWGETVQGAEIRSLYIRPDARRLGLGSALLRCLWRELQKKQSDGAELLISYIEDGERSLLTPFLAESGFLMEQARFPQGEVTLAQLQETLLPRLGGARGNVKPLYQLLPKFQRICAQWLKEQLGAQLTPYLGKRPESFIFIEKDEVQGAALLREQENAISLDYCYVKTNQPQTLALLFSQAITHLGTLYAPDTQIRMTLSTPQAQKLYEKLFGTAKQETIFCSGSLT